MEKSVDLFDRTFLGGTLFSLDKLLNAMALAFPEFKDELKKQNITVQMKIRDNTYGRLIKFKNGFVTGKKGIFNDADVEMIFENENIARKVMLGEMYGDTVEFVNAAKAGSLVLNGEDEKAMWFSSLLLKVFAFDVLYMHNY